jgi:hypothetical protein
MDDRSYDRELRRTRRRRLASASARWTLPKGVTVRSTVARSRSRAPRASSCASPRPDVEVKVDGQGARHLDAPGRDGSRLQGLMRALIAGMVKGTSPRATSAILELKGTGYRVELKGTRSLRARLLAPDQLPAPQGHHGDDPRRLEGHRARPQRRRQGAHRPDGREDPRVPPAGAVRRQGRSVPRRAGPRKGGQGRQGRQEVEAGDGHENRRPGAPQAPHPQEGERHDRAPAAHRVPSASTSTRRSSTTRRGKTLAHASTLSKDLAASSRTTTKSTPRRRWALIAKALQVEGHRPRSSSIATATSTTGA